MIFREQPNRRDLGAEPYRKRLARVRCIILEAIFAASTIAGTVHWSNSKRVTCVGLRWKTTWPKVSGWNIRFNAKTRQSKSTKITTSGRIVCIDDTLHAIIRLASSAEIALEAITSKLGNLGYVTREKRAKRWLKRWVEPHVLYCIICNRYMMLHKPKIGVVSTSDHKLQRVKSNFSPTTSLLPTAQAWMYDTRLLCKEYSVSMYVLWHVGGSLNYYLYVCPSKKYHHHVLRMTSVICAFSESHKPSCWWHDAWKV